MGRRTHERLRHQASKPGMLIVFVVATLWPWQEPYAKKQFDKWSNACARGPNRRG